MGSWPTTYSFWSRSSWEPQNLSPTQRHPACLNMSFASAFLSFDGRLQRRTYRHERHHAFRRHLIPCHIVCGLDRNRRQIAERCGHALHCACIELAYAAGRPHCAKDLFNEQRCIRHCLERLFQFVCRGNAGYWICCQDCTSGKAVFWNWYLVLGGRAAIYGRESTLFTRGVSPGSFHHSRNMGLLTRIFPPLVLSKGRAQGASPSRSSAVLRSFEPAGEIPSKVEGDLKDPANLSSNMPPQEILTNHLWRITIRRQNIALFLLALAEILWLELCHVYCRTGLKA